MKISRLIDLLKDCENQDAELVLSIRLPCANDLRLEGEIVGTSVGWSTSESQQINIKLGEYEAS